MFSTSLQEMQARSSLWANLFNSSAVSTRKLPMAMRSTFDDVREPMVVLVVAISVPSNISRKFGWSERRRLQHYKRSPLSCTGWRHQSGAPDKAFLEVFLQQFPKHYWDNMLHPRLDSVLWLEKLFKTRFQFWACSCFLCVVQSHLLLLIFCRFVLLIVAYRNSPWSNCHKEEKKFLRSMVIEHTLEYLSCSCDYCECRTQWCQIAFHESSEQFNESLWRISVVYYWFSSFSLILQFCKSCIFCKISNCNQSLLTALSQK